MVADFGAALGVVSQPSVALLDLFPNTEFNDLFYSGSLDAKHRLYVYAVMRRGSIRSDVSYDSGRDNPQLMFDIFEGFKLKCHTALAFRLQPDFLVDSDYDVSHGVFMMMGSDSKGSSVSAGAVLLRTSPSRPEPSLCHESR